MIKRIAALLAAAMLCLILPAALAEARLTLEGLITETGGGYFLLNDVELGPVRVNLEDGETAYEGVITKDTLAVGQYVYVQYNGAMTRSVPPQVTAEKVSCFTVAGTVTGILNDGYTVEGDPVLGTVIVHTDDAFPLILKGVPVTVYYSGVMALSYPPQVTAVHTVVPALTGVASGVTDGGFTLTGDTGTAYRVTVSADTAVYALPAEGERLTVYYDGTLNNGADTDALAVTSSAMESGQAGAAEE